MNKIVALVLSFCISVVFGQDSEIKAEHNSSTNFESHEFKITNESDSLLCIFFSGFHGRHNTTHYKLPVIDLVDNMLIYKLDFAQEDLLIDAQCKYLQVLTIQPLQTKTITIDLTEISMTKKIVYYFYLFLTINLF